MTGPASAPTPVDQPGRSTAAEQRALATYAARLRPTIQTAITAAQAAGAAGRPLSGSTEAVLKAVGLASLTEGILAALALQSLDRWTRSYGGSGQASRSRRAALWQTRDAAADTGAQAGADRLAQALADISRHAHDDRVNRTRAGLTPVSAPPGVPSVPAPGAPTTEKPPYQFTDADGLASAVAVSTKESAKFAAASQAGWGYKTWVDSHDHRVRTTHKILGSKSYDNHRVPIDVPFLSPSGAKLRYPGDPEAPIEETIHCRCHMILTAP